MTKAPEGYTALYFLIGTDEDDDTPSIVQATSDWEQIHTCLEWEKPLRKGILFVKKKNETEEVLQLILDVKPEEAALSTYHPDIKIKDPEGRTSTSFDNAISKSLARDVWDRKK